jgi:hypothetical protein
VGIAECNELKTQYILAVFHAKKQRKVVRKINLPLFFTSDFIIFSVAINIGTSAIKRITELNGIGGQANQSKNALKSAS